MSVYVCMFVCLKTWIIKTDQRKKKKQKRMCVCRGGGGGGVMERLCQQQMAACNSHQSTIIQCTTTNNMCLNHTTSTTCAVSKCLHGDMEQTPPLSLKISVNLWNLTSKDFKTFPDRFIHRIHTWFTWLQVSLRRTSCPSNQSKKKYSTEFHISLYGLKVWSPTWKTNMHKVKKN